MNRRTYPGYPEYILLDLVPPDQVRYKRGVGDQFLFNEEFEIWQRYFCSSDYAPPPGKDILLFHVCTWAKPYDMSEIGTAIRSVTDRFPQVHRVITSNVGVVPCEYQMNSTFCAYDWKPDEEQRADRDYLVGLRSTYQQVLEERIRAFLLAQGHHYRAVGLLGFPVRGGIIERIYSICKELNKPFFSAPNVNLYRHHKETLAGLRDLGQFYTFPDVLDDLRSVLERVTVHA